MSIIRRIPFWGANLLACLLLHVANIKAEDAAKPGLFLPKSPVAAAYMLARLSNKELIEAPRGEFVYTALLQRAGLERKYRLEAVEGLAKIRGTDALAELIRGVADLDRKGEDYAPIAKELITIILQKPTTDLAQKREAFDKLVADGQLPLTRQAGYAGIMTAEGADKIWMAIEAEAPKLADLLGAIPFLRDPNLRSNLYPKVQPLLARTDSEEIRRGAITAISTLPGHDAETFAVLSSVIKEGSDRTAAVASLQKLPRKSWPKEKAPELLDAIMGYLKALPADQRTSPEAVDAFQLASDLVPLLPADQAKEAGKALRAVGVSVFVIRTINEQMIYDKLLLVVEPGKPVEIVLINEDAMPHNLVVVTPGAAEEIGKTAEKMPAEPDAQGRIYIPNSPKVLHATKMVDGGRQAKLSFTAPTEPGEYQYICSFPGHWMRMQGILAVVADVEGYLAQRATQAEPKITEWKLAELSGDFDKIGPNRDLLSGKESFQKLGCVQCHKLGADGYAYGPELTDVFKRFKDDRASILTEILEPSKVIAERYRNHALELKDGDELGGMIVKQDAESLWIQMGPSDALIRQVKKTDVKKDEPQASSMMPQGLLNTLSKDQILNLLSYLQAGGSIPAHQHEHSPVASGRSNANLLDADEVFCRLRFNRPASTGQARLVLREHS